MIIVRIDGGLGNQMFCYAFAIALRESLGKEVLIDSHRYKFFPIIRDMNSIIFLI